MTSTTERYVGRIVGIGRTLEGFNAALYRLSSRTFPKRSLQVSQTTVRVVPQEGYEHQLDGERNIFYNAIVTTGKYVVVGNGSHTDFIAEAIDSDLAPQKAIETVLASLGYERNEEKTPRIVGVVPGYGDHGWLAIVREDAFIVRRLNLEDGKCTYIATREVLEPGGASSVMRRLSAAELAEDLVKQEPFCNFSAAIASAVAVCRYPNAQVGSYFPERV